MPIYFISQYKQKELYSSLNDYLFFLYRYIMQKHPHAAIPTATKLFLGYICMKFLKI